MVPHQSSLKEMPGACAMSDQAVTVTPPPGGSRRNSGRGGRGGGAERGSGRANALEGRFAATHTSLAARFPQA